MRGSPVGETLGSRCWMNPSTHIHSGLSLPVTRGHGFAILPVFLLCAQDQRQPSAPKTLCCFLLSRGGEGLLSLLHFLLRPFVLALHPAPLPGPHPSGHCPAQVTLPVPRVSLPCGPSAVMESCSSGADAAGTTTKVPGAGFCPSAPQTCPCCDRGHGFTGQISEPGLIMVMLRQKPQSESSAFCLAP